MANYSYKKFPHLYPLATVHPLQSNGRTDIRFSFVALYAPLQVTAP